MGDAPFGHNEWALLLGGSSGFGLATAHKLAEHGLNICVVHRDRRGAMSRIEPEFEKIRERGVSLLTFNKDALHAESRAEMLESLAERFAGEGKVRLLLHSIAFGNLKLIGPEAPPGADARATLARESPGSRTACSRKEWMGFGESLRPPGTRKRLSWKTRTWSALSTRWAPAFSPGPRTSWPEGCSPPTPGFWE
jgi:hypothetical protein